MKKSFLKYGNFFGVLILIGLVFAIYMEKFYKPDTIDAVVKKKKISTQKDSKKELKPDDLKTVTKKESPVKEVINSKEKRKNDLVNKKSDKVVKKVENSAANPPAIKKENATIEDEPISLTEAVSLAQEKVKKEELSFAEARNKERLNRIIDDKLFVPYRGSKVVGPSGEEMPTMVAPKNLELIGICAMGGEEGAMINVPQRKAIDQAEVLKRLKKLGSDEWAKWMVDNFMQGGKQKLNIELPKNDAKAAAEWKAVMDDIFVELEYNKVFFSIGEEVYDEFILAGLLSDGVILTKGSQEYFLPLVASSRSGLHRMQQEVLHQERKHWENWSYLYRQQRRIYIENYINKYITNNNNKRKRGSYWANPYNFGSGKSPTW
ncbi:hypothetical protein AAEX28_00350 [Lentisphaerota bacterium WC36G]|nr:hypothetical protein LJT99_03230 [Lentisphaerae bacterium WC36]